MSDTPKTVQRIIDGSSHCLVCDGNGDLHDAVKAKISDLRQIERQLAEARKHLRHASTFMVESLDDDTREELIDPQCDECVAVFRFLNGEG